MNDNRIKEGMTGDLHLIACWVRFEFKCTKKNRLKVVAKLNIKDDEYFSTEIEIRYSDKEDMTEAEYGTLSNWGNYKNVLGKIKKGKRYYMEYAIYDFEYFLEPEDYEYFDLYYDWQGKRSIVVE